MLGRVRRTRDSGRPLLSVVVPVYNVADYLSASLDSILRQPVSGVEVIIVDDGSTDDSARIAQEYADRQPHLTLLRQSNAGVSVARNVAIPMCSGRFLTFVDPDDELPQDAWSTMLATLRRSGSDFVVGKAERLEGTRRSVTPLMQRNHGEQRLRTTIDEVPLMLADVFVWNKIFRRDFWDAHSIWFPEGTRYQDQPAMTQAFLAARSFDVLTDVVYEWRAREDLSSATQKRRDLSNLQERVNTKRMTIQMVEEFGSAAVTRTLFAEILPIDMWEHFRSVPGCTEEYWTTLRDAVVEFWNPRTLPFEHVNLPAQQRLMGWFVAHSRRADLEELLVWIDANRPLPDQAGELAHPWREDPAVPPMRMARPPGGVTQHTD